MVGRKEEEKLKITNESYIFSYADHSYLYRISNNTKQSVKFQTSSINRTKYTVRKSIAARFQQKKAASHSFTYRIIFPSKTPFFSLETLCFATKNLQVVKETKTNTRKLNWD